MVSRLPGEGDTQDGQPPVSRPTPTIHHIPYNPTVITMHLEPKFQTFVPTVLPAVDISSLCPLQIVSHSRQTTGPHHNPTTLYSQTLQTPTTSPLLLLDAKELPESENLHLAAGSMLLSLAIGNKVYSILRFRNGASAKFKEPNQPMGEDVEKIRGTYCVSLYLIRFHPTSFLDFRDSLQFLASAETSLLQEKEITNASQREIESIDEGMAIREIERAANSRDIYEECEGSQIVPGLIEKIEDTSRSIGHSGEMAGSTTAVAEIEKIASANMLGDFEGIIVSEDGTLVDMIFTTNGTKKILQNLVGSGDVTDEKVDAAIEVLERIVNPEDLSIDKTASPILLKQPISSQSSTPVSMSTPCIDEIIHTDPGRQG